MARRIDFFDDSDAPPANSVVPSANVVAVNDDGQILLIRRTDNDNWALPGPMDLGESLPEAAARETVEETGIRVELTGLVPATSHARSTGSTRNRSAPSRWTAR